MTSLAWLCGALTAAVIAYLVGRRHGPVREVPVIYDRYVPTLPDGLRYHDEAAAGSDDRIVALALAQERRQPLIAPFDQLTILQCGDLEIRPASEVVEGR